MTDFLLNESGALQIKNGDFVLGNSDAQNALLILRSEKGAFVQSPLLGVGIKKYLNGSIDGAVRREIQLQLEADGYTKTTINNDGQNISVLV